MVKGRWDKREDKMNLTMKAIKGEQEWKEARLFCKGIVDHQMEQTRLE